MRNLILAAAAAATLSLGLGTVGANAHPLIIVEPEVAAPPVVLVAGGCGFGFHRGPWGGCRPNGGLIVGPGPGPRVVPFYPCHRVWTAFGWRRVCN